MRFTAVVIAFLFVVAPAIAGTIRATEAGTHVGQAATVEGVVGEVHTARSGKATFIDLDGTYPNEAFTAVIFASSMAAVGDVSDLTGKTIDVTGTIKSYEGRPEIIVSARNQISVK